MPNDDQPTSDHELARRWAVQYEEAHRAQLTLEEARAQDMLLTDRLEGTTKALRGLLTGSSPMRLFNVGEGKVVMVTSGGVQLVTLEDEGVADAKVL